MEIYYLKFTDKEEAYEILKDYTIKIEEDKTILNAQGIMFDEVGIITIITGYDENNLDENGNPTPIYETLEGYHINILDRTGEFEIADEYKISPATPHRKFSISDTVYMETKQKLTTDGIQNMIEKKCKEYGFESSYSIGKYIGFDNPYREAAETLASWIAACWEKAEVIKQEALAGERPIPTVKEVLAEMPIIGG